MVGAGGVGDIGGQLEIAGGVHAVEHLLDAGLLEGHAAGADGLDALCVDVDAEHGEAAVGKADGEGQADAAEAYNANGGVRAVHSQEGRGTDHPR